MEDYLNLTLDFALNKGIKKQMDAFKQGFNLVFPIEKLGPFSPNEVKSMLCGDQSPVFTREDIIKFTEPKLGYTRESPAFQKFVNVLVNFTDAERKAFLQFTTGCSSLPPGKKKKSYFHENRIVIKKSFSKIFVNLLLNFPGKSPTTPNCQIDVSEKLMKIVNYFAHKFGDISCI